MSKRDQDIAYFLSFCIEQYKTEKKISGAESAEILGRYGVLDYLADHYEVLHTQSRQWLMEDIDEFISLRNPQVNENHENLFSDGRTRADYPKEKQA